MNAAKIVIYGPCQIGKTLVLARLQEVLEKEFGATTFSQELTEERNFGEPLQAPGWQRNMIRNTIWELEEVATNGC